MPKPFRDFKPEGSPESERQAQASGERRGSQETVPKRQRRVFSAADKLRLVTEADSCQASGKRGALGALLRREGVYSSQLSSWRTQLGAHGTGGLVAKKPGRKPKFTEAERRCAELMKRNAELERKLHIASALIALQKKAHEVLGLALPESDGES